MPKAPEDMSNAAVARRSALSEAARAAEHKRAVTAAKLETKRKAAKKR